jgi:hypothetical protein
MPLVFFFTTSPKDPNRFHFTYFLNPLDHGPGYATRRGVFLTTAIGNRHGGTISLIGVFVWQIFGLPLSTTLDMCMIFYFCLKWKFLMFHAIHNFFIFSFQVSFRFYVCIASVTQILNFFIIILYRSNHWKPRYAECTELYSISRSEVYHDSYVTWLANSCWVIVWTYYPDIICYYYCSPNTFLLHLELLNFMIIAMSTQLLCGPSPGANDVNPFLDAAMAQVR